MTNQLLANVIPDSESLLQMDADLNCDAALEILLAEHPTPTVLLAPTREIVYANQAFLALRQSERRLIGLRLGEALNCENVADAPAGCGTGEPCRHCGANKAIRASLRHERRTQDHCRFQAVGGALITEFRLTAYPVRVSGYALTAVAVEDIAAEQRRSVLERTFFHDVLNTISGLHGLCGLVNSGELPERESRECLIEMETLAESLAEEVLHQRKLLLAEKGELDVEWRLMRLAPILEAVDRSYQAHPVARNRTLRLVHTCEVEMETDLVLLKRLVGNLIKNALEATPERGLVTFWAEQIEGQVRVSIHNDGEMPHAVQQQLFERSFSTKAGTGRGIGTYSVKLFTERFLKGKVDFTSNVTGGTTFTVTFPMRQS